MTAKAKSDTTAVFTGARARKAVSAALCAAALAAGAAPFPEYRWDASGDTPATGQLQAYRGDTVRLRPRWTQGGRPADTNGWAYTLYWQTNGMGSAWWTDSEDPFTWRPSRDCGADGYLAFIRAAYPGGTNDRARLAVRMLHSPGAVPNALPLPARVIDFAAVAVTNAPWVTAAESAAAIAAASNALAEDVNAATNALAGRAYDFSRNRDIIRAVADLAAAHGAAVTNNPAADQGGN